MYKYDELFITTTDTVVGIGAPINKENEKAIYHIKNRSGDKGLVIMVGSIEQARKFKEWNKKAEEYAAKHWPGAVTLVLSEKLAIRMPDEQGLCNLIKQLGPVYMTSANLSGEDTYSFEKAKDVFQEIKNYYYFGKGSGKASKLIDVRNGEVLRK